VFDTKKGTDDESKKHKKNKRSTHKRDDCLMKLLKSSSNFTLRTRIYMWTHALSKKGYTSVLFVRSSVNSRLTFTQKSRSLSLVKFVPSSRRRRVVRVVRARSRHERRKESLLLALARAL
jgi:hypothetical protein